MVLIQGGRVIGPAEGIDMKADVVLGGRRIAEIIPAGQQITRRQTAGRETSRDYERVIDADGMIVTPGLVDVHVHFRDPGLTYKEDIHTGTKAAAKDRFTTAVCMANTKPIVDNEETFRYVLEEGKRTGVHVLSYAAVSEGFNSRDMTDVEGLLAAGAAGFTDDGIPLMEGNSVRVAMERTARLDTVLSFHEEDKALIRENGINHGRVSDQLGIYGSPALAGDSLVARDCMIALDIRAMVDVQHISPGHSVEMMRPAEKLGAKVWAKITPRHFILTEDAVLKHGTLAKVNPPLRIEEDRQMLIRGLRDGTIDMIATGHAPCSREEKDRPLTTAPSGVLGLETTLALGITSLIKPGRLTMVQLMERMSSNSARLYELGCDRVGAGAPTDLVIFDKNRQWTVKGFESKSSNSPFLGETSTGQVVYTIRGGAIACGNEE